MNEQAKQGFLNSPNGRIAYEQRQGDGPGVLWLGGFKSDMTGTKAQHLSDWARDENRAYTRFDYTGHGASEGVFEDGCISDWTNDALCVLQSLTSGPQILVGSSMGGWIAALIATKRPELIAGIVFIAPAPDFTEELMTPAFGPQERETLLREGRLVQHSEYSDEPTIITQKLLDDGRRNLVLGQPLKINGPVRILQGMADPDVPFQHAIRLAAAIDAPDLQLTLTKSGDHRLSTPQDLERLIAAVESVGDNATG